jgi:hypothetical protein
MRLFHKEFDVVVGARLVSWQPVVHGSFLVDQSTQMTTRSLSSTSCTDLSWKSPPVPRPRLIVYIVSVHLKR